MAENEYGLLADIRALFEKLVPRNGDYRHPSNADSHLRSILLPPDRALPIAEGQVQFGTWQSLLFVETDVHPRRRTVMFQVMGE